MGRCAKSVSEQIRRRPTRKNLILGNHGKAFIRATRPLQDCVTGLPCPNCGSELAFLEQYHRRYCYACGRYAPEGFGDRGAKRCPMCTGILSFVAQYERYYCYRCNAYPPEGVFMESKVEAPPTIALSPATIGDPSVVVIEPMRPEEPKPAQPKPDPAPVTVEVPAEPTLPMQSEEIVEEEIPPEEPEVPAERPKLAREEILEAKKPVLMDLCKAYDLDPTGTKEQLRERLLSYLDDLESEEEPEEILREPASGTSSETAPETPVAISAEPAPMAAPVEATVKPEPVAVSAERTDSKPIQEKPKEETTPRRPLISFATTVMEERRPPPVVMETLAPPVVATPQVQEAVISIPPIVTVTKVDHPCPTCGRALTYISQYNRWYCYSCRAYAPVAKSKFACPSCGASLRWISQYERWWCDSCRKYAPADLPRPERAVAVPAAVSVTRAATITAAPVVHRHRSPGGGIGFVGFGMALFVVYEVLVDLPAVLSVNFGFVIASDVAFGLRFFAFVFVAFGAILGLYSVRDRR